MARQSMLVTESRLRYTPPLNVLELFHNEFTTAAAGDGDHILDGVPAGALLILMTGNQHSNQNVSITDDQSLTWTKRAEAHGALVPNAEVWTAVFTAGGDINIVVDWGGGSIQSTGLWIYTGHDGVGAAQASSSANAQAAPNISITTTRADSIIIVGSFNWNGVFDTVSYRGTGAVEDLTTVDPDLSAFYYRYPSSAVQPYTVGFTEPDDIDAGYSTVAIEIRANNAGPDTTPPTPFTLSEVTHGTTSAQISWTPSTDNVLLSGYRIYQDGALIATQTGTSKSITGLTAATAYDFLVQAYDASGNTRDSNEITITTNSGGGGGSSNSDHIDLVFTPLTVDYSRHLAGNYRWGKKSGSQIVAGAPEPWDDYRRYTWCDLEVATENNYDWSLFDADVQEAIDAGRTFSFGIMTSFPGGDDVFNEMEHYSGTDGRGTGFYTNRASAYPLYLHNYFQAGSPRDWIDRSGNWCANYNHAKYVERLRALHAALRTHINATSYTPEVGPHADQLVQFADVIEFVDVRGMGSWGELHSGGNVPDWPVQAQDHYPSGAFPSIDTWKEIIDLHTEEFPDWMLVVIFNIFDHYVFVNTQIDNEVGVYALNASNNWGPLGFRDDHIGDYMGYNDQIMRFNNEVYDPNGPGEEDDVLMHEIIMERWKQAPLMGEPPGYSNTGDCGVDLCSIDEQLDNYHYAFWGNGNFGGDNPGAATEALMLDFWERAGHILRMEGGEVDLDATDLRISIDWKNYGNAPVYNHWEPYFQLRDGGTVIWESETVSNFDPFRFLPQATATNVVDTFDRPDVPDGTYDLVIIFKDPRGGYRRPLSLGIEGRFGWEEIDEGYYPLGELTFSST